MAKQAHLSNRAIRVALIATYPLLALSGFALLGLFHGAAFIAEFSVTNATDSPIRVTPIGAVGQQAARRPLPICLWGEPPVWSSKRGDFAIPPRESINILYDMDDINFSEIVVHDRDGERGQLVVNSEPALRRYHAPAQKRFVIKDFDELAPVPASVRQAVDEAQVPSSAPLKILGVLLGPWIVFGLLTSLNRYVTKSVRQYETVSKR